MQKRRYHYFLSPYFCHTVLKNFWGEPFCASENIWYRKSLWIGRGKEYHNFPLKIFCRTVPKNFVGEHFLVLEKTSGIENSHASRFSVVIINLKTKGKGWDYNPYVLFRTLLSYPLCHTKFWHIYWNHKNIWDDRFETGPTAWGTFVLTPLVTFIFKRKKLAKLDWKKNDLLTE